MGPIGCNYGRRLATKVLVILAMTGAAALNAGAQACPKVMMFDGLDIQTQNNEEMAKYWGQTIGVDGFFLNNVMQSWNVVVGDDENNVRHYQALKQFQELYSKYGVTRNFIKVALYDPHDWRDPAAQERVISNFRSAAHLAKFAGLQGMSLDLEPYTKGIWELDPAFPEKGKAVSALAKGIGGAIRSQFRDAVVIVYPEVLMYTPCPPNPEKGCQVYALAQNFWDGLAQSHFSKLIIGTETSFDAAHPARYAEQVRARYREDLRADGVNPDSVPIELGIWPLGKTYTDKSARSTPAQFHDRLHEAFEEAMREHSPYVYIYGHGSAWQTNGPYGKSSVDPHFDDYVRVLHLVKEECAKAH